MVKELVLDLLGWGVSPEYLVECGLTRHAIYYAFTELNLKLPKNLDTTGIDPYPFPRPALAVMNLETAGMRDTSHKDSVSGRPSTGHPLPAKPMAAILSSTPIFTTGRQSRSPSDGNEQALLDIEAQKRQELLARRAVLASRKKSSLPSSHVESSPSSSEYAPTSGSKRITPPRTTAAHGSTPEISKVVPLENVDDFLNSMISESSLPPPKFRSRGFESRRLAPQHSEHPEAMDVDANTNHSIDVVANAEVFKTTLSPDARIFHPANAISKATSNMGNMETGVERVPLQPSAPIDASETPDTIMTSKAALSSIIRSARDTSLPPPQSSSNPAPVRRGTKRPVASDFVDLDVKPTSLSRSSSFSVPAPPPHVRRKVGSFAGLNGHGARRCVIDLSDSEDGEDDPGGVGEGSADPQHRSMSRNSAPIQSPRPIRPLPPSSLSAMSKPPSVGASPSQLMEKEQQIERMKAAIARREQERLKKLDAVSCFFCFLVSPFVFVGRSCAPSYSVYFVSRRFPHPSMEKLQSLRYYSRLRPGQRWMF